MLMNESVLKVEILCNGVDFTNEALEYARREKAKGQNMVYNKPIDAKESRPQELFLTGEDGYQTVVSCVAPNDGNTVNIDVLDGRVVAFVNNQPIHTVRISFVPEPEYYSAKLSNGDVAKTYVSSCGYDELNILPWRGCAISKGCLFCGVNSVTLTKESGLLTALEIAKKGMWSEHKERYLSLLTESIEIAMQSQCFDEHMHVIIISGDLTNETLNLQSEIYCEIANTIYPLVNERSTEGIVAVLMPPKDLSLIQKLYTSGVRKLVYNLEVGTPELFEKYCPGKNDIGYDHIMQSLEYALSIFGKGNVWSNFVLGLEPIDNMLELSKTLLQKGIVPSANVLHLDEGNRLDCKAPSSSDVIRYFTGLAELLKEFSYKPYYCSKALRTSLSNEAYAGRFNIIRD